MRSMTPVWLGPLTAPVRLPHHSSSCWSPLPPLCSTQTELAPVKGLDLSFSRPSCFTLQGVLHPMCSCVWANLVVRGLHSPLFYAGYQREPWNLPPCYFSPAPSFSPKRKVRISVNLHNEILGWLGEGNEVWGGINKDLIMLVMNFELEFPLVLFQKCKSQWNSFEIRWRWWTILDSGSALRPDFMGFKISSVTLLQHLSFVHQSTCHVTVHFLICLPTRLQVPGTMARSESKCDPEADIELGLSQVQKPCC